MRRCLVQTRRQVIQTRYLTRNELEGEIEERKLSRKEFQESPHVTEGFEKWRRSLNKAEKRNDLGTCEVVLQDICQNVAVNDPSPDDNQEQHDIYMLAWAAYAEKHDSVIQLLISLSRSREAGIVSHSSILLAKTLEWCPDKVQPLLEDPNQIFIPILEAAQYYYRQQKASRNVSIRQSFIGVMLCLYELLKTISGTGMKTYATLIEKQQDDMINWWRSAFFQDVSQAGKFPLAAVAYSSLLSELIQILPGSCKLVTTQDLNQIEQVIHTEASPEIAGEITEFHTHAKINIAYELIGTLMYVRFQFYEDYVFLNSLLESKWHVRFARLIKTLKWGSSITLMANARVISGLLKGSSTLAIRWPMQVWQAELPQIAIDKLRYVIGYLQESLKHESDKDEIQRQKNACELVAEPAMELISSWCLGELLDSQYNAGAYNNERLSAIRFVNFPGILSRTLRIYPTNKIIIRSSFSPLKVLLGCDEQIYDIRDVRLFQSLEICRARVRDNEIEKEILDIMMLIKDRMPN